jgi:hypothetical protein
VQPALVLFLRNFKKLFGLGEFTNLFCKLFPGYCLTSGIFFNSLGHKLVDVRSVHEGWAVSASPWDKKNIAGDISGLLFNFVFWSFMLYVIESGLGATVKNMMLSMNKGRFPAPRTDIEYDEDVRTEEKRVLSTADSKF